MKQDYSYHPFDVNIAASHSASKGRYEDKFHLHNYYEIYFFLQGDVNFFVNKSCYHLEKGNLLIFNNQDIHKAVNITDEDLYERITIHFDPNIIREICTDKTDLLACFEKKDLQDQKIVLVDSIQYDYFVTTAKKLIKKLKGNEYGSDVLTISYLIQILVMINDIYSNEKQSTKSIISPKILSTLEYIDSNLTRDLSLDKISEDLSISKYHLSHTFKNNTGTTLYQYILIKRIALAKKLLLDGKNVTEACQESGFNDYSNFIRTFKKETGLSPGNFGKY